MKFGIRTPSFKKRLAARTSWKRFVRHSLGFKAPRGWGWLTNPKRAAYNRVYNLTSISVGRIFRRRRGSHSRGLVFLLLLASLLLAAYGTYLLVVCVVGLVGWLIRVATTHSSDDPAPEPTEAESPPPPSAEYLVVTAVEPSSFDDPERARSAAREVFSAWLRQMPRAPRNGADLVSGVEVRKRLVGRLVTGLEGRRFAWKTIPVAGRHVVGGPPLDPASLDPWNPQPDLAMASRHVAVCTTCQGRGRLPCEPCAGSGRTTCLTCSGSGKYEGTTAAGSPRLLNCGDCRGRGDIRCNGCIRGLVTCQTCGSARKVERWLEVDQSSRQDAQVEPRVLVERAFAWGQGDALAQADQIGLDARILDRVGKDQPIALADLPSTVPEDWRLENWPNLATKIEPGERVTSQTFTLLEVPSTEVAYSVLREHRFVAFEGLRMLAPPPWSEESFARRAAILGRVKLGLAGLPVAALAPYIARGAYFMSGRATPWVGGLSAAAAVAASCVYAAIWNATIGRRAAAKWAMVAIAPLAAAALLATLAEPSRARARAYLDAGQLVRASIELEALGSAARHGLAPLWADLHLKEALAAESCIVARRYADEIPVGMAQNVAATARADTLALVSARRAFGARDLDTASRAIECASNGPSSEGRELRGQIALAEARSCIERQDWGGALAKVGTARQLGWIWADEVWAQALAAVRVEVDTGIKAAGVEKDPGRRVAIETATLTLATTYLHEAGGRDSRQFAVLRAAKERDEKVLARRGRRAAKASRARAGARESSGAP